jgi:hypothetical protein
VRRCVRAGRLVAWCVRSTCNTCATHVHVQHMHMQHVRHMYMQGLGRAAVPPSNHWLLFVAPPVLSHD